MNEESKNTQQDPVNEGTQSSAGDITAESIEIIQGGARNVQGSTVTIRQGGAQSATADSLHIRQGGVVKAKTEHLEMVQGGIILVQTDTANLTASQAGMILSQGNVTMDQAGTRVLLTGGDVTMDQSGTVLMIAGDVKAENCGVVFLLARKVGGTVNALFGPRESLLFGAAAGIVAGLILLLGRQARRR